MSVPGTLPFSTKTLQSNNNNNNNNLNSNNNLNNNTSEGEQSPTANNSSTSSAHEFSVFANVNIQGSSTSLFSQSQVNLNSIATSVTDFSDTISLNSAMMAPELPKRSNSIISLPNNSNSTDVKPVLSPRSSTDTTTSALRFQPIVSPKLLDSVHEERTAAAGTNHNDPNHVLPPTISPRTDKLHSYQHQNMTDACASSTNRSPFQNTSQHRVNVNPRSSTCSIR